MCCFFPTTSLVFQTSSEVDVSRGFAFKARPSLTVYTAYSGRVLLVNIICPLCSIAIHFRFASSDLPALLLRKLLAGLDFVSQTVYIRKND